MTYFTADADSLNDAHIESYRKNGFIRVRGIITPEEAESFREAADEFMAAKREKNSNSTAFKQYVNTWTQAPVFKGLTLHPSITAVAAKLAGVKLRLWHDHLLVKEPKKSTPTHFHQDQPYWPHENSPNPLSCWVALNDVPAERGCMSFIPGSHEITDLTAQNLNDGGSLFGLAPQLQYAERVTLPLRAGDCTFHHGRTAHMANANVTDENRYGVAIIYIDATATFNGGPHVLSSVIREYGIKEGEVIEGEQFPLLT